MEGIRERHGAGLPAREQDQARPTARQILRGATKEQYALLLKICRKRAGDNSGSPRAQEDFESCMMMVITRLFTPARGNNLRQARAWVNVTGAVQL